MAPDQNAVCKAMGALFLQHRVACLEREVERREADRLEAGKESMDSHRQPLIASQDKASYCPAAWAKERLLGCIGRTAPPAADVVYVVDASVLIYSLRSVHRWLRDAAIRVVVPCEAVRTLDLIKKGCGQVSVAARRGARFLEEKVRSPATAPGTMSQAPGLWIQREHERLSLEDAERIRVASSDAAAEQDDLDLRQAPLHIQEALLCGLWHQQAAGAKFPSTAFAYSVALPPPASAATATEDDADVTMRVDGATILPWARAYGLREAQDESERHANLKVLPTSTSWLRHCHGLAAPTKEIPPTALDEKAKSKIIFHH
ncbi:unnamed protein product [Parajaminaea phylloscopi]